MTPAAFADSFDNQINQLNQTNTQSSAKQQQLKSEATTLAQQVANLQAEAASLNAQVQDTQDKIDKLHADIDKLQKQIDEKRNQLNSSIHQMYIDGDISMIEMLASSHDLSHYVDEAQYQETVQTKVKSTMDSIKAMSRKLEADKKQAEQLLADQQAMKTRADSQAAEANRLLQLNEQQQVAYNQNIASNNAQIASLRAQQAVENARGFTPSSPSVSKYIAPVKSSTPSRPTAASSPAPAPAAAKAPSSPAGTSYPWANVPFPNELPDPWGMYKRQCVSYTAWKVANSGRHMPYWGGRGNANQWDDNARAAGIPVDTSPRAGDVAISNAGSYGHAMYVESVNSDGTINISQYNAGWDGAYSTGRRSTAGLVFIHF